MTLVDDIIAQLQTWGLYTRPQTLSNGTFASDTDWTLAANWTVAAGKLVCAAGAVTTAYITPIKPLVEDWVYQVRYTVSDRTAGSVTISIGDTVGTARSSNATFDEQITCGGITDPTVIFTPDATFDGSIDDVYVCPRPIIVNKKKAHEIEHSWSISVEVKTKVTTKTMINGTSRITNTPSILRGRCNGVLGGESAETVRNAFRDEIVSLMTAKSLCGSWTLMKEDSQDHDVLSDLQLEFKQLKFE